MMKKRMLFILCLLFVGSNAASAQTKTVTNQDLEKFRQTRLQAEREYRENYAKLGFPSPEELEKQRAQDGKDRAALAEQIRRENLEREKLQNEADYRQAQLAAARNNSVSQGYAPGGYYGGGYYGGVFAGSYPLYGYRGYNNRYYNNPYRGNVFGTRGGIFYNSPQIFGRPAIRFNNGGGVRVNVRIGTGVRGGSRR